MKATFLSWLINRDLGTRAASVDALRGLAIAGMILVNHPGPTGAIYAPLVHAPWDGWTLADTIFPTFLFVVGVSIALSMSDAGGRTASPTGTIHLKIIRRTALLILINIALINFPYYELATLKITGTLTRIALCSASAALLFIHVNTRGRLTVLVLLLSVHFLILVVSGPNAILVIDRALLGSHLLADSANGFDSTSLTTTGTGIATTLLGTLCGEWLRKQPSHTSRAAGLLAYGFVLFASGSAWGWVHPVNKVLWSSSFTIMMGGISMMTLGLFYFAEAHPIARRWLRPMEIAGLNALVFYVGAQSLQRLLVYGKIHMPDGSTQTLRQLAYDTVFGEWVTGKLGALLFAIAFLMTCYLFVYWLYSRRIFVRL